MSKYLFTIPTDGAGSWILWILSWAFTLGFFYVIAVVAVVLMIFGGFSSGEETPAEKRKKKKKEEVASDNSDLMDAFRSPLKSEYGDMEDDRSGWRL